MCVVYGVYLSDFRKHFRVVGSPLAGLIVDVPRNINLNEASLRRAAVRRYYIKFDFGSDAIGDGGKLLLNRRVDVVV